MSWPVLTSISKTRDDYFLISSMDYKLEYQVEEELRQYDRPGDIFNDLKINRFPQQSSLPYHTNGFMGSMNFLGSEEFY